MGVGRQTTEWGVRGGRRVGVGRQTTEWGVGGGGGTPNE